MQTSKVCFHQVGLLKEALGNWNIKYPGPDGMIREDYIERLELKPDGRYAWNPSPSWAMPAGKWGVFKTEDGPLKLGFTDTHGQWR